MKTIIAVLMTLSLTSAYASTDCRGAFTKVANLGKTADEGLNSSLKTYKTALEDFRADRYEDSLEAAKVAEILANQAQKLFLKVRDGLSDLRFCGSPIAEQSQKLSSYVDQRLDAMDIYLDKIETMISGLERMTGQKDFDVIGEIMGGNKEEKNAMCFGQTMCPNGMVVSCQTYGQGCSWFVTNGAVVCTGYNQYGQWVTTQGRCW